MNRPESLFVRCRVASGFFDTEFLVIVAGSSAYVSRSNVKPEGDPANGEVDGVVSAYVIERANDQALIELPGQPVVGGIRTWVPESSLLAAPAWPGPTAMILALGPAGIA